MSTKKQFIDSLNEVLSWELAGIVQYLQHSVMVTGSQRVPYAEWFQDGSEEAHDHAEAVANRITALGGIPTVEPARIRQAADLEGMLEAALELEQNALAAWERAHDAATEADVPRGYVFWLEEHVAEEQEHVDDLRKMTKDVSFSSSQLPAGAAQSA
jgi:bacterioferritin